MFVSVQEVIDRFINVNSVSYHDLTFIALLLTDNGFPLFIEVPTSPYIKIHIYSTHQHSR